MAKRIDDATEGSQPKTPRLQITVSGYGLNQRHDFAQRVVTIGRDGDRDVVLDCEESGQTSEAIGAVSRRHAHLTYRNGQWLIEDTSRNGTFLRGARLTPQSPEVLADGDCITIEGYELRVGLDRRPGDPDAPPCTADVSAEVLTELKRGLHLKLIQEMDLWTRDIKDTDDAELRQDAATRLERILRVEQARIPPGVDRQKLTEDILNEALGLGPLEELLQDADVSEIMVVGHQRIFVERGGCIERSDYAFSSDASVRAVIERIVSPMGRRIDESSPSVDARLPDGSRVHAIIPPLSLKGPCITIRKFSKEPLTIDDLIGFGSLNQRIARFLGHCVLGRQNMVISGGTGSGKTSLLNVLSSFIPDGERIVTIEDAAELQLRQEHVVTLQSRPQNVEGSGEVTIRDLVKEALRMRPDRIIVGECRGAEALDMLQAMNTGHDGSLTTAHANNPRDLLRRLEVMTLTAGEGIPSRAIREQIASAIDIIVQQIRFPTGERKITHVSEIVGYDVEDDAMIIEDIFVFSLHGHDEHHRPVGEWLATGYVPSFIPDLITMGVIDDGEVL